MLNQKDRQSETWTGVANNNINKMVREFFFKYRSVLLLFLLILILFGIRSLSGNHFRHGAENNAMPAIMGDNILDYSDENNSLSDALYINLDIQKDALSGFKGELLGISPESLLDMESLKIVDKAKGPVILISEDPALLARSWMLLAQKGVRNLFIMGIDSDYESFRYQFRPDTTEVSH